MTLLLSIFQRLKTLDTNKLSPRDAARWMIQPETEQEKRVSELAKQLGFNQGIKFGFFVGIGVCILIWGARLSAG